MRRRCERGGEGRGRAMRQVWCRLLRLGTAKAARTMPTHTRVLHAAPPGRGPTHAAAAARMLSGLRLGTASHRVGQGLAGVRRAGSGRLAWLLVAVASSGASGCAASAVMVPLECASTAFHTPTSRRRGSPPAAAGGGAACPDDTMRQSRNASCAPGYPSTKWCGAPPGSATMPVEQRWKRGSCTVAGRGRVRAQAAAARGVGAPGTAALPAGHSWQMGTGRGKSRASGAGVWHRLLQTTARAGRACMLQQRCSRRRGRRSPASLLRRCCTLPTTSELRRSKMRTARGGGHGGAARAA